MAVPDGDRGHSSCEKVARRTSSSFERGRPVDLPMVMLRKLGEFACNPVQGELSLSRGLFATLVLARNTLEYSIKAMLSNNMDPASKKTDALIFEIFQADVCSTGVR